jgi:riboflavin synthase
MFTGLIEEIGTVRHVASTAAGARIEVAASHAVERLAVDDSVNVAGVRVIVVERDDRGFAADLSAETLGHTTLGALTRGSRVNLERAATADRAFAGHFVQGNVDATTKLVEWQSEGEGSRLRFALPKALARYITSTGFVALDGVSLTIGALGKTYFDVAVAPRIAQRTTLSALRPGSSVNLEVDLLAKYVERILSARKRGSG